jgi:lipopolysaccharide biosynthesis glycosyltransferase
MTKPLVFVAFASDERYAPGLAVAVRSLVDGSDELPPVYVVDGGLTRTTKSRLRASWPSDLDVSFTPMSASRLRGLPVPRLPGTRHLNAWIFARLFLPELLPSDAEYVLYLDTDVLVRGDVGELAKLDLGTAPLAAVRDEYIGSVAGSPGLVDCKVDGLDGGEPYFNSGVLLLNLPRWREERLGERVLDFLARHREHVRLPEQDALNALVAGRWMRLDPAWNVLIGETRKFVAAAAPDLEEAKILHFVGAHKPWQPSFPDGEYQAAYRACRERTAWAESVVAA